MDQSFLNWLHQSALSQATRDSRWLFGALESAHFLGLTLLVGAMALVDLRLMGVIKHGSGRATLKFTHLAVIGLLLIILSGIGLFSSEPAAYWGNPLFRIKMALVLLAFLNIVWFEMRERRLVADLADGGSPVVSARFVGLLSLTLWLVIIVIGRFLPVKGGN